ncbi:MAG: DUF4861 domain-containing protein [Mongoliibacter sp.]|uniref:DUF4861 family protein n=1 Tax=Mongoliibacter sp. TaxID=2022438 RepID=UPI0012F0A2E2|nr:DUF4861 family protein [Mongoliibacter sp.]TVP52549.1 MAG: DUF4861 domain-containing protein [Mongoliibacter sp.]
MKFNTSLFLIVTLSFFSCKENESYPYFILSSESDHAYTVVNLPLESVQKSLANKEWENIRVKNIKNDTFLDHQWLLDEKGSRKNLLVGVSLQGNNEIVLEIEGVEEPYETPEVRTYSRFVPERTDDYTWENDKVAFRTYGPDALRRIKEGKPGGTFSSGIDAWHKKVPYPIIDKWYEKELSGVGSYHKDTGEGADFYHVGISRGVGGTGYWHKDTLYAADNFIGYKTLAEGPLRTVFELDYDIYSVEGVSIKETKHISLDLGSQLTKYEIEIDSSEPLPYLTVGITLHENEGITFWDDEKGVFGYWEPMEDTFIGTGLVVDPSLIESHMKHESQHRDQSHILVNLIPDSKNKVVFYAGFAWDQAGDIRNESDWESYLQDFSGRLMSPIKVRFIEK